MNDKLSQKIIIESLAMDLKRVALGLHRGSFNMANRFREEAFQRAAELENLNPNNYLKKLLLYMKKMITGTSERVAEDALMLSTLFQNFAIKNI
ncbi:MAG: hypothetical protein HYV37_01160 [Candidatus Levyibacteriota bacterium]|nr:MAG: hypothetical protein HYV37_01160 [Candidatus Levybacteria bacterium]